MSSIRGTIAVMSAGRRPAAYVTTSLAIIVILVGGGLLIHRSVGNSDHAASHAASAWHIYPNAFSGPTAEPSVIVPDGAGCFLAAGRHNVTGHGTSAALWTTFGDCTRPTNITPRPTGVGDALPSDDNIAIVGGTRTSAGEYILMSRETFYGDAYAYDTSALSGTAAAGFSPVASFTTPDPRSSHVGPSAVVSVGRGFVAVGYADKTPTVWRSPDGHTWASQALPGTVPTVVNLQSGLSIVAGPRGHLVAIGSLAVRDDATAPTAWLSTDSGATWRAATMPTIGGSAEVRGVVYTGHDYVAVGTTGFDPHAPGLVLTSTDGRMWKRDDTAAVSVAGAFRAVTVSAGVVVASALDLNAVDRDGPTCAAAWTRGGDGRWTSASLGCHRVPEVLSALPDGRLVGAAGTTLFVRAAGSAER